MRKILFAKVHQERSAHPTSNFKLVSLGGYRSFSRFLSGFGHDARLKIVVEIVSKKEFVENVYGRKQEVVK